jgi:serine/threonine-protein kinase
MDWSAHPSPRQPMSDSAPQRAREPAAHDLTGTTVGRFFIRRLLGQGGMGQVYEAEDTRLKRPVALKRMAPQLREDEHYRRRFLKEAECASRLTHQHIAGIYDVFEQEGEVFLVMEFVAGETLRQRMSRPIALDELLDIAAQCATALVAAQEQGIVHRDLKPENIMLTAAVQVKILDFGVARLQPRAGEATTQSGLSTTGGMAGTLAYMPPEALLEKAVDARSDVFSLGVTLYEVVTGQHPFLADTFLLTVERILHHVPPPVNLVNHKSPEELARILNKMLSKIPADRYATSADLLVDLRALHRTITFPTLTRPVSPAPVETTPVKSPSVPLPMPAPASSHAVAPERSGATTRIVTGVAAAVVLAAGLFLFWPERGWLSSVWTRLASGQSLIQVPVEEPIGLGSSSGSELLDSGVMQPPPPSPVVPTPEPIPPPAALAEQPAPPVPPTNANAVPPAKAAEASRLVSPQPSGSGAAAEGPYVSPGFGGVEVITDITAAQAVLTAPDGKAQECNTPCRFEDLRPGRYTMQISKSGYRTLRRILEVRAGRVASENQKIEPQRAQLEISSNPSQAEVFINGERQTSLTPTTIGLPPGRYRIVLQKAGFGRHEGSVELKDEDIRGLSFQLQAQQQAPSPTQSQPPMSRPPSRVVGWVEFRSVPPGADILVDGNSTGQRTPFRLELPAGQHSVTLFLRGYQSVQRTITVRENQAVPFQEVLAAQ